MRLARRRERQRLEPHLARAAQRREEQALAAEQRGLDAAHHLDVVVHARLHRHDAAGVHAQRLAGGERASPRACRRRARSTSRRPVSRSQDEALAAEQPGAEALGERDAERHALGGAQERVLLRDQLAAELREVQRP